ncbi:MAG: FlgD immunoglobulin-like domain containing protein [Candidatus Latescibacterota bacterium]|jgi:hypothetical protein
MRASTVVLALGIAVIPACLALAQEREGYVVGRDRVVVEGADHWQAWQAAEGVRVIGVDGSVRPRFLRRDTNAVLDAGDWMNVVDEDTTFGGISAVGVTADTTAARRIIDGDPATWWEPNLEAGLDNQWVEIDLGRAVIATQVVVRFVPEGQGDPFLKFRVLVSDGTSLFGSQRRREFLRVGQVAVPNKDQREFVFPIGPFRPVPEGIEGEPVQFIRLDLLDSDGPRGRRVTPEEYADLPKADQGAVDYYRRTAADRQIPVVFETWRLLPAAEQGEVRYYRRERPRLAELEVRALGDNVVALTQRALFAEGDFFTDLVRRFVTDGLLSTSYPVRVYDRVRDKEQVTVDLGAKFWVERLRLVANKLPLTGYQLRVSDGSLAVGGSYVWHDLEEQTNPQRYLQMEAAFPPREVRLIELRRLDLIQSSTQAEMVSEIQAYGEGYVSEVVMTSPLIQLDQRRMFSRLSWEADVPPGTAVELRTRSGDELLQIPHYYNRAGQEITALLHERLDAADRGPIVVEELPGPDWSNWSEPYGQSGEPFRSPTPRRMTMVQVILRTFEPLRFAAIRRLALEFAPPLVDQVVAEVWPVRQIPAGIDQEFTVHLRYQARPGDPGFDRLRLSSSSATGIEVVAARAGSETTLRYGQGRTLWPGPLGLEPLGDQGVELTLPSGALSSGELLELVVRTRIYLTSTTFRLELSRQAGSEVVQVVDAGDAGSLVSSNSLVVVSDLRGLPLLGELSVTPAVCTPNGDGINDQAVISLAVYQLEGSHRLKLGILDLAGRPVRDLSVETASPSGEHRFPWDGRDDQGRLLPPGIYLVRLSLSTDGAGTPVRVRPVQLAY